MNKLSIFFRLLLVMLPVLFNCCEKDEEDIIPPVCSIVMPADSSRVQIGDIINIRAEATDSGSFVKMVYFYIDEVVKSSFSKAPYQLEWPTSNEDTGFHIIRAVAIDKGGNSASDECVIDLVVNLPDVITASVGSITENSAVCGGNVTNDGGATVTARGVCWSKTGEPTLSDNHTTDGTGTGSFTSLITGLSTNTSYYVRAYATNSEGTNYGNTISFATSAVLPSVITEEAGLIKCNSARSGGNILDDGGMPVTVRGICWDTSPDPVIDDNKVIIGSGTGSFTANISGLVPATKYYARAYAVNSVGTAYGNTVEFTTVPKSLPAVETAEIKHITSTTASGGGIITADECTSISARGTCWSNIENPTLSDSYTTDGSGTGTFISYLNNLKPNTTYFVRAYATHDRGDAYGNQLSFTTNCDVPTVKTTNISAITNCSAQSGGNVINDGGSYVNNKGVCWSTSPNPTISDYKTFDGSDTGSFISSMTRLEKGTTYYLKAYAANSYGTGYGDENIFTTYSYASCPGTPYVTDYDGNEYETVQIGNQCWMKENLKTTHYADGTPLVDGTGEGDITGDFTTKYYFAYNDDESNVFTYGRLYTWAAVMSDALSSDANPSGVQGICPSGWHVPGNSEWIDLANYLGGVNEAGGKLKEIGTVYWKNPNTNATNKTGFTALPTGDRYPDGKFSFLGYFTSLWSSMEYNNSEAVFRCLQYNENRLGYGTTEKSWGKSVRCVKD
jgi:uncharacterized protein (TIGR02145 family)